MPIVLKLLLFPLFPLNDFNITLLNLCNRCLLLISTFFALCLFVFFQDLYENLQSTVDTALLLKIKFIYLSLSIYLHCRSKLITTVLFSVVSTVAHCLVLAIKHMITGELHESQLHSNGLACNACIRI